MSGSKPTEMSTANGEGAQKNKTQKQALVIRSRTRKYTEKYTTLGGGGIQSDKNLFWWPCPGQEEEHGRSKGRGGALVPLLNVQPYIVVLSGNYQPTCEAAEPRAFYHAYAMIASNQI